MKVCVAQAKPVTGDVQSNIAQHKRLINLAVAQGADTIIFPELSLTGYEPALANALATTAADNRLNDFQQLSHAGNIIIGVGLPTKDKAGTRISMVLFHPHQPTQVYNKQYLHADEEPFFVPGQNTNTFIGTTNLALAICYELSVPEHAANAHQRGAQLYIASVAKTVAGVEKAHVTLADIARKYSMTVMMSNCIGPCEGAEGGGRSAIWNNKGKLLKELDNIHEGLLIMDTATQELVEKTI